ncbi:TIGR02594 family protein [Paracoccus chinensis]|uniref:TIGR02594 family protein n=1 Tax=Paracoccus chinensis TaxID=525640 RepID=A0A1G9JX58_9RHOB|nr:TIGR02594 family protein [Paracoccus chinensis]SDL41972.1 TIGR02594 family protein [Paracoccus chinensis]
MDFVDYEAIQRRLHKLGYNPGPIDGVRGRLTINAVKLFQAQNGLVVDGLVGPATYATLFGSTPAGRVSTIDQMPWMQEALRLVGLKEDTGLGSNPVLIDIAKALEIDYADDEIPWCGLFVGHCIGSSLPSEALPTLPLLARAWARFGVSCAPQIGAVLVFWRGSRNGSKGHVGFYHGEDATHFHVLGGNQSDTVNVSRIKRDRFLAARWPLTALAPSGQTVLAANNGQVQETDNEA